MSVWVNEGDPERIAVGAQLPYQLVFDGITSASNPTSTWYDQEGNDVTSTLASGSDSASGNTVTLKTFSPTEAYAGSVIVMSLAVTLDGNVDVYKMKFQVESAKR